MACEDQLSYLVDTPTALPPHIDRITSCFHYEFPINQMIITGKYNFIPGMFEYLGHLAAKYIQDNGTKLAGSVFCPIPLSPQRLRWRGFNQSGRLCQALSAHTGIPAHNLLKRVKNTKTQKNLSAPARERNMAGSFGINTVSLPLSTNIIIVDDVVTTGSTLLAAAAALKMAGYRQIQALTIAKD
jgi:ComF family protein